MATEKFANKPITTLNGSIIPGATSLTVTSPSLFPVTPQFRILVEDEIMIVTGVTGSTYTITRGAEGTVDVGHSSGVSVTHILTAGALNQIKVDLIGTSTPGTLVVGGTGVVGSTGLASDAGHIHPMPGYGSTVGTICQGNDSRLSDDRVAPELRNTTGLVNVSSAPAPSAGQALIATDSSHATWQNITTSPPMIFVAGVNAQASSTLTRVGSRESTVTATMTLMVQLEATAGTAYAQLYDNTTLSIVASVMTTNTMTTRLTSAGLSIVSGHVYELQVWLVGGNPAIDKAIITYGDLS
jgi:hypothetical protein